MAASRADRAGLALAAWLLICSPGDAAAPAPAPAPAAATPAPGAEPAAPRPGSLEVEGAGFAIDYEANRLRMRDVTITQGAYRIRAQEATASGVELRFDDSRWEFRGAVRIGFPDGTLDADAATVTFRGNRIDRATATGSPATFQQKLPTMAQPARGRAGTIDFAVQEGRIRLSRGAWLSDGRNEIESDALVYSIRAQRVETETAAGDGRVRITITPDAAAPAEKAP